MSDAWNEVISPCIQICTIDEDSGLCIGCSRTAEEISNWIYMTPEEKIALTEELKKRS